MLRKFAGSRSGAILPIFAIAALPLIAAMGAAVDYSRAYDERQTVQDALDSAVLAAGRKLGLLTSDQVKTEANNFYLTNVGGKLTKVPQLNTTISVATIVGTAELHVPTYFLGIIGLSEIVFQVKSSATLAMGTLEVVMALDNSGSMSGTKIATLKSSAADLATRLWGLAGTSTAIDPIKIGIVPFAAAVNVGPAFQGDGSASWLDKTAVGTYHGDTMEANGASAVNNFTLLAGINGSTWGGCVEERPQPYDTTDDGGTTATPGTMFVPLFAPDEPDNLTSTSSCSATQKVGSGTPLRYNCAPSGSKSYNNYLPDVGDASTCGTAFTVNLADPGVFTLASHGLAVGDLVVLATTGTLPTELAAGTTYYVKTVPTTNTFTVAATSGGTAIRASGSQSGTQTLTSSVSWTCANGNPNCAGGTRGRSEETGFAGKNIAAKPVCKYGTSTAKVTPSAITVGGLPGGPNFMCTTPAITALTTSSNTVTSAINGLVATGATNILSGVSWAWRVLSPGAPFVQGRAYSASDNQKILILMTDGENTYYPNSSFLKSWYAALGYTVSDHLKAGASASSFELTTAMNARTQLACTNAKAAGVRIFTVGFEINSNTSDNPAATLAMLKACATDQTMYYDAQNESALADAFTSIGEEITLLRVSE